MSNINKYLTILESNKSNIDFAKTAKKMMRDESGSSNDNTIIYNRSLLVTAPVLISYVLWVLNDAISKNIERLYFLARDGYIMYEIANRLIKHYKLPIESRYLYCSRLALRKSLFLIKPNLALEMIFQSANLVTPNIIMSRMGLSDEDKKLFIDILGKDYVLDEPLNTKDLLLLKDRTSKNEELLNVLSYNAGMMFENTIGYFSEQGLLENNDFALVDSGWTGSIQKSIRLIIQKHTQNNPNIRGYYFGITSPVSSEDGEYNSFYIGKGTSILREIYFNNNLFECLCSANHGMTTGYEKNGSEFLATFNEHVMNEKTKLQTDTVVSFVNLFCQHNIAYISQDFENLERMVYKLLKNFMHYPSYEEAKAYGAIKFSDDSTENYLESLSHPLTCDDVKHYMIINRILRKVKKSSVYNLSDSMWIRGSIALTRPKAIKSYIIAVNAVWNMIKVFAKKLGVRRLV